MDRPVFNVENSIAASGGNALDAPRVTPGVNVSRGQISMIGKSGMMVMVDDRRILLSEEDLIEYLKSLQSDNIKSIEVITNPPSKYEAGGNSSIINIQLKKAKIDSWSNTIRSSYNIATHSSYSIGDNFTDQKNKLSILFNISGTKSNSIYTNDIHYYYPKENWNENPNLEKDGDNLNTLLNMSYNLSNTLSLGFQYLGNLSKSDSDNNNQSNIYDLVNQNLFRKIESIGNTANKRNSHSLNPNLLKN